MMIDETIPVPFRCRAGSSIALRTLVRLVTGELATPSNVSAIACKVTRQGGTSTYNSSLTVGTVLLATPELGDDTFDDDSNDDRTAKGYNFKWQTPVSVFPTAGWYTVQIRFTHNTDLVTTVIFEGPVRGAI